MNVVIRIKILFIMIEMYFIIIEYRKYVLHGTEVRCWSIEIRQVLLIQEQ